MTETNTIRLTRVTDSSGLSNEFKTIYEEAFPRNEQREWEQITELLSNPIFNFFGISDQEKRIGLLSVWNLEEFHFIEHLAIRDIERGQGFGSQVMRQLLNRILTPVFLEADEPVTKMAQKRIDFYKRLEFSVCDGDYYQPPYSTGKSKVKMLLMSFPEKFSRNELIKVRSRIYNSVYGFSFSHPMNS